MIDGLDALARRFRQGNAEAFEEVFRRFRPLVHTVAVLEVHNVDDADDITQDVFRKALSAARTLDEPSSLRSWLLAITRHEIADQRKRERLRAELYRDRGPTWLAREQMRRNRGSEEDPANAAIRKERAERIRGMIATLPHRFRLPVALRLLEEHSYRDIADLLGQPFSTVKNSVARGGRMLVDKLRSTDVGQEMNGGLDS